MLSTESTWTSTPVAGADTSRAAPSVLGEAGGVSTAIGWSWSVSGPERPCARATVDGSTFLECPFAVSPALDVVVLALAAAFLDMPGRSSGTIVRM